MGWMARATVMAAISALLACGSDSNESAMGGATSSGGSSAGGGSVGGSGVGAHGGAGGSGGATTPTAAECLKDHHWVFQPDYDQFDPIIGSHCKGTKHQNITGVEKLVFLGDSVTEGTPPTPVSEYYRVLLADALGQKFPGLEVDECAVNGAKVGDLLGGDEQILDCFPSAEPLRTLVVMTMGGNDVIQWPTDGLSQEEAEAEAELVAAEMREAIEWFSDPARFPGGVFVVFSNVYEYTDGTANLDSCPGASFMGLSGTYFEGALALATLEEQFMQIAVDTGTDMVFMLEEFCGHGYQKDDPNSSCYLGPDTELWFDLTCIHPNPTGHAALAQLFETVIDG